MAKLMFALVEASLFMLRFNERLRPSGIFLLTKKKKIKPAALKVTRTPLTGTQRTRVLAS